MKILVTGGVRSGKSAYAESLLGEAAVTYVAPGPASDDADWAARIAAHKLQRPAHWTTVESDDLVAALDGAAGRAVLVDCLGTWLTSFLDHRALWEASSEEATAEVSAALDTIVTALIRAENDVVLVTNEVGLGIVPEHRSGRLFRDLLGLTNQRLAAVSDGVHLVIAGRVLKL